MDGVGAENPVEVLRTGGLGRDPPSSEEGLKPVSRVFAGEHSHHLSPRIGERGLDRVQAEKPDALDVLMAARRALCLSPPARSFRPLLP